MKKIILMTIVFLGSLLSGCISPPENIVEGHSTYHLVDLKSVFSGNGKLLHVKTLAGIVEVYESRGQKNQRENAAKNAEKYDKSKEIYYHFVASTDYPTSKPHMMLISKERAEVIAAEELKRLKKKEDELALKREKDRQEKIREENARQETLRREAVRKAAEKETCLSKDELGICLMGSGNKSTYLCGWYGLESGGIFNPDCYYTDRNNVIVNLLTRNNAKYPMKDITFYCSQIAKSGTVLGTTSKIIYDIWRPGEEKSVKLELSRHSQMDRIICKGK